MKNVASKEMASARRPTTASDIIAGFNTWAFKREQPDNSVKLHACAETALRLKAPIEFVTYWGKGPRTRFALPDAQCLDFLEKMMLRIADVYEFGARLHVLMTDTHAELNQYSAESIGRYFGDIEREGQSRGFRCRRLNDVVVAAGVARLEDREAPDPALRTALRDSAAKWYRGSADHEAIALTYFHKNMQEKFAVEAQYPNAAFITFNNSNFRALFPDNMPIFYMYSLKRGVAVKPWFIGEDDHPTGSTHAPQLIAAE